jgi:hypothetical protein
MRLRKPFLRDYSFILIIFILGRLTLWGGLSSASAQMVTVRVAYSTLGAIVAPVWITRDAGLDRKEGVRYLLAYPDRAKKTISKYARIRDPEVLDYTLRLFSASYIPSLMPDPERMKTVYEGLAHQRPETKKLAPSAYIYDPTIKKIHQSGFPGELDRLYPGTRQ